VSTFSFQLSFLYCLCPKCPKSNVSKVSCLLYFVSRIVVVWVHCCCLGSIVVVLSPLFLSCVYCFCLVSIVFVLCLLSYIFCFVSIVLYILSCVFCLLSFVLHLLCCVYLSMVMHQLSPVYCLVYIVPTHLSISYFFHCLSSIVHRLLSYVLVCCPCFVCP